MTSLRIAFVQTCPTGNPCLFFLSGISCLLSSLLGLQEKSTHQAQNSLSQKKLKLATSFSKTNRILMQSKERSTWIDSFARSSLVQETFDDELDFEIGKERIDFVHALQLINQDFEETSDIKTVKSEQINFGQLDPNSTQISEESDMDLSQIDDF